jgi:ATP-binding cassette subfamily C protein
MGAGQLAQFFATLPPEGERVELPPPAKQLDVRGLAVAAPGTTRPIIQNVSFSLQAGSGMGIIGPSASGKSTLARALVGALEPMPQRGSVRLDGAALDQWAPDALGRHVGYLPQEVDLFDGTIGENIARFDAEATSDAIISAAKTAGVHELILQLPQGYDTRLGADGIALSAGQRQRVALARALYRDPFLVVLDEPNSNLDSAGDAALAQAITSIRARGGVVVVVAHRPSALAGLDQLLVLANGMVTAFGPKEEVLRKVTEASSPAPAAASPAGGARGPAGLKVVGDEGLRG